MLRRAFTLIEVLVTIGIITLLASLAMPGIKSVRESSRSSECATRLRQLSTAAQSYSNVFRGVFPPAILFEMTSSGVRTVAWDFAQGANGEVLPGPLWSFTDHPFEVQQCPAFIGSSTFGADPYTGFNYNTTFIGAEGSWPIMGDDGRVLSGWKNARRGLTVSQHNRPAETGNCLLRCPSISASRMHKCCMVRRTCSRRLPTMQGNACGDKSCRFIPISPVTTCMACKRLSQQ